MKDNEALKYLKEANRKNDMLCVLPNSDIGKCLINALEEIQQYREIGTVEKIKEELDRLRNDNECQGLYFTFEERQDLARQHKELEAYRSIGTVEECRAAMEKQKEMITYCDENDCSDCPFHNTSKNAKSAQTYTSIGVKKSLIAHVRIQKENAINISV